MPDRRPDSAELAAARGQTVPDLLALRLDVLFCGINPGLYSGAVGHHFARPGNRFWKVLHGAGFTSRVLEPSQESALLAAGCGITNLVARPTASAAELGREELRAGVDRLARTVEQWHPSVVAFLGMGAYRTAFGRPQAQLGEQPETLAGARLWLLPNPSGLQARYQLDELISLFSALRHAATPSS